MRLTSNQNTLISNMHTEDRDTYLSLVSGSKMPGGSTTRALKPRSNSLCAQHIISTCLYVSLKHMHNGLHTIHSSLKVHFQRVKQIWPQHHQGVVTEYPAPCAHSTPSAHTWVSVKMRSEHRLPLLLTCQQCNWLRIAAYTCRSMIPCCSNMMCELYEHIALLIWTNLKNMNWS